MLFLALFATYALTAPSTPKPKPPRPAAVRHEHPALRPGDLYSLRARRRFASYLRLRLLELREAGLERAAQAVERRLSVDDLLRR
jgi:hypothetical protein